MRHRQLKHEEVKKKFSDFAQAAPPQLVLVANNLKNATNLGALFRLADAAGIRHIYAWRVAVHNEEKVRKVARATNRHIDLHILERTEELLTLKKKYDLVALEITSDSIPYMDYQPVRPVALIIGNEKTGVAPELLKLADQSIHIPMYGKGSSMNVAMAAGIAVYGLLPRLR